MKLSLLGLLLSLLLQYYQHPCMSVVLELQHTAAVPEALVDHQQGAAQTFCLGHSVMGGYDKRRKYFGSWLPWFFQSLLRDFVEAGEWGQK